MKKYFIVIYIFIFTASAYALESPQGNLPLMGRTYLAPRSQSTNAALELVGWTRFINQYCQDFYGAFAVTPVYTHSFRPNRLAEYFFGTDQLVITGSQVANRDNAKQILADYFGLSPFYQSTVFIKPEIRTFFVDFNLYVGWQDYYFRIHAPYVWTKWTFDLFETPAAQPPSSNLFPPLYMDVPAVVAPAQSFTQALRGGITYGQVTEGIAFGNVRGSQTKSALSEIQLVLGHNFINCPYGHAGFNLRGSIPTGTTPNGQFLFEPTIGNGHHFELGVGFTGHLLLWEKAGEQTISMYSDVNITHLFKNKQRRSFDLLPITFANPDVENFRGFGSRYMLMKQFDAAGNYINSTIPVINRTTLDCNVHVAVEFDIVVMAAYFSENVDIDFGYNAWIRTREKISLLQGIPSNTFGLKGIQNVATPAPSNATQSTATLFGNDFADQAAVADPFPPIFISTESIDVRSAANPFAFTHKFFTNFSYHWHDCRYLEPYIGIGGEVEFQGIHPADEIEPNKIAISQWGVWLKGGFGF